MSLWADYSLRTWSMVRTRGASTERPVKQPDAAVWWALLDHDQWQSQSMSQNLVALTYFKMSSTVSSVETCIPGCSVLLRDVEPYKRWGLAGRDKEVSCQSTGLLGLLPWEQLLNSCSRHLGQMHSATLVHFGDCASLTPRAKTKFSLLKLRQVFLCL